jgi:hypothetical protein
MDSSNQGDGRMCHRLVRVVIGLVVLAAGLALPACESASRPQSLTGETFEPRSPRYQAHGKGQQWGRIVYDR